MAKIEDIVVLCDKPSDERLFKSYIQNQSPILGKIKDVAVLPSIDKIPPKYRKGLQTLLQFDRADYYFCYNGVPILVVEMTVHGYTGDQCLQRFARISKTAEEHVPFIYFAPTSRTRFDELDQSNPSYRNVSSDLYKGFIRLMEIYQSPVVAVQWKTNNQGIPSDLINEHPMESGINVLIELISSLLSCHLDDLINKKNILQSKFFEEHIKNTELLGARENVSQSEVRFTNVPFYDIAEICNSPLSSFEFVPRSYFMKGKAQKLLTLMALEHSQIKHLLLPNDQIVSFKNKEELINFLPSQLSSKPWIFYHSGYQWRSEPNVGIVTNIDITMCRSHQGKTAKERDNFLVVHWPRIFFNADSRIRAELLSKLTLLEKDAYVRQLFHEKAMSAKIKKGGEKYIAQEKKAFGKWNPRTTVARIYRDTCDLLILNDIIILGNMWSEFYD